MTWIRLDDHFADHPKIVAAGPIAAIIHIRALCYASRYLTDGWIPDGILSALFTGFDDLHLEVGDVPEILVREGLWEKATGGYRIHDYLKYNPSKSTVLEARQKDSNRKKKGIQTDSIKESKRIPRGIQPSPSPSPSPLKRKKNTYAHRGDERMNGFDAFWKEYPRKKSKGPAEKAWRRWRGEGVSRETILEALNAQKSELVDRPADKIPYPATWLNAKSWENEPDSDPDAIQEGPHWEKGK